MRLRSFGGVLALFSLTLGRPVLAGEACHAQGPVSVCSNGKGPEMPESDLAKLGSVALPTSCGAAAQVQLDRGVAMLHSFWFDAARASFEQAAAKDPGCAMAFWGVAMSFYHPLWTNPSPAALKAGSAAVTTAESLAARADAREREYVAAVGAFYRNALTAPHAARVKSYQRAMQRLVERYPRDREAATFYAIALLANASPSDKTFAVPLRAGKIAEKVFSEQPNHPGAAHYIIHAYDYPPLAERALAAARSYAKISPSSAHALHMPSHTFTQLGLWQESISSNLASAAAARAYANQTCMAGAWEEELHALDYLAYAYLQLGRDREAYDVLQLAARIRRVSPERSRKAAYAFAAIPARYAIERGNWSEAVRLEPLASPFPRANALTFFARGYARARLNDVVGAREDVGRLAEARDRLRQHSDEGVAAADLVEVQRLAVEGWVADAEGNRELALQRLRQAAQLEDRTDDGPVTPGPVVRARELLGELLLARGQPVAAAAEFRAALKSAPQRLNVLIGLAKSAQMARDVRQLAEVSNQIHQICAEGCDRPQVVALRLMQGG
jgi:tetratricopeptide (TPR) repeat protein